MRSRDLAVSKAEQAYVEIHDRIVRGEFTSGHRLILSSLAGELGFSTVPVREAIRRLEAEGLVTFEKNVGATVTAVDPTTYLHTMQTLAVIEGAATALAAPVLADDEIGEARELNRAMRQSLEDFDPYGFTRLNAQFHEVLYRRCPNTHILDLVNRGWTRLNAIRTTTFEYIPGRARGSVAEHDALLDMIAAHLEPNAIENAARTHRMTTLNTYLAHLGQPPSAL